MNFRRYIIAALPAILACAGALAQGIDPTLEVSRTYIAGGMDFGKSTIGMSVPDSLLKFNADFKYSVADKPYRGAYEFSPHTLDIHPVSAGGSHNTLFLRVGAGFPLHPMVDLVVSPRFGKAPFIMNIYGTGRSYIGRYRGIGLAGRTLQWNKPFYNGYDVQTRAGIDGRADWNGGFLAFDLGYSGYADKDFLRRRGYDAGRIFVRAASNSMAEKYFFYDASLFYQYAEDKIVHNAGKTYATVHDFGLNAIIGPKFSRSDAFLMGIVTDLSFFGSSMDAYSGKFSLEPKYRLERGRWNVSLGLKIAVLMLESSRNSIDEWTRMGQIIYPDIKIDFAAVKNSLDIYLDLTGGPSSFSYGRILERNPHFSCLYERYTGDRVFMANSIEHIHAVLGVKGNAWSRLFFDVRGGYILYMNMPCDAVVNTAGGLRPGLGYAVNCNYYFAALDMKWKSEDVAADVKLTYQGTDIDKNMRTVVGPSPFVADASVIYNWKKRIYAGIHCNAALARTGNTIEPSNDGNPVKVPGFADLGVSFEYYFSRKMSVWAYGGNLINMTIQRIPLYAEGGISFTAGFTLRL